MKKNYVLDTNVLLHDPTALHAFEDNNVIIPIYVIEEIDNFKKQQDELGRNAREVSRIIDGYRLAGSLSGGVDLPGGGILRLMFAPPAEGIPRHLRTSHAKDDLILAVALQVKKMGGELPTVFVSMDTNLRIRSDALGIEAEDYQKGHIRTHEVYTGHAQAVPSADTFTQLFKEGWGDLPKTDEELVPNQFLTLKGEEGGSQSALARVSPKGDCLLAVRKFNSPVWGIKPRNREQTFAMDLLLNPDISLVTLVGKAGTGKTLVAVACGLNGVTDEQLYERLLISRPVFPLGKDIGYLPGTIEEKLNPWMQPIYDSVDFLLSAARQERKEKTPYGGLIDMGIMQIEPLTYIRGRSIPKQFLIVDESQNLTPHEVKTILTRAGEGTKVVLTGDPYQIDHPYLDSLSNGLSYAVARFKGSAIAGTVTLERGERSQLADEAANRL
jgi:PhoH-like ATPase